MKNIPAMKIAVVAASRNGFSEELSANRRKKVAEIYRSKYDEADIYECPICVGDNEVSVGRVLKNIQKEECNALCIYLGNYGPEIAETMLAEKFFGPVMFCAAAEDDSEDLFDGRGDAYCGMLNASYALGIRNKRVYIPEEPVGDTAECAEMIHDFLPIARAVEGLRNLKIISFGPRPNNFLACNAPIKPLFDLGVEIEENSELDLLDAFQKHEGDKRIPGLVEEMATELGAGSASPGILPKLAQYELTLMDWIRTHKGQRKYVALTSKCWPAFAPQFGFVPCYVNSRLTAKGYPVACEVDIYGALSEYIGTCVTADAVTILDINNSVPRGMYEESIRGQSFIDGTYGLRDLFMAFHCGNTSACKMKDCKLCSHQMMSKNLPEEITQGTLQGDLQSGKATLYRLQSTAAGKLCAYVAQGEILPVATKSYGSIGICAVKGMGRFYRHVLVEKHFPHHGAVLFGHYGQAVYEVFRYLGIEAADIDYNRLEGDFYETENPFYRGLSV
ncbi:L-fucose/L-arabinose isomerase family protein [Selenomonas ruminantium]|uniref:L-fucose isomerase n=1 Tax=Selenomonas ruminantium TaxID=971 RepID=A0A1H0S1K4_SELRU|nr:fucose isomerase [Selenomonas ruminantium]SDP35603.1 L-fucose isomerase [Selenomonas ruminantium]